jgi:hypothetical protein
MKFIYIIVNLTQHFKQKFQDNLLEHTGMTYTQMLMGFDVSTNQEYYTNRQQGPIVSEVSHVVDVEMT